MRKLSYVMVAAMLLTAGSVFANNNPKVKSEPTKSLSDQIGAILEDNNFNVNDQGALAQVLFTLNSEKEIVVLNVETNGNTALEGFIKNRLNYQQVDFDNYVAGKNYIVKVRVEI